MASKSHNVPRELPAITPDMPPMDAALELTRAGFRVVPLLPTKKRPYFKEWQNTNFNEQDVIDHWQSHPTDGVGVIVSDGLVVLDADGEAAIEWLTEMGVDWNSTPHTISGREDGGRHLFFQDPGRGWSKTELRFGDVRVDVITDGGQGKGAQVVIHHDLRGQSDDAGKPYNHVRPYRVNVAGPIGPMPSALVEAIDALLKATAGFMTDQTGVATGGNGYHGGVGTARQIYEGKEPIYEGRPSRDVTLFKIGCYLRGQKGMSLDEIERELLQINATRCVPPLPDEVVRKKAEQACKYTPGALMITEFKPSGDFKDVEPQVISLDDYDHNDEGHGRLLVDIFGKHLIYKVDTEEWAVWSGTYWKLGTFGQSHAITRMWEEIIAMVKDRARELHKKAQNTPDKEARADIEAKRDEVNKWARRLGYMGTIAPATRWAQSKLDRVWVNGELVDATDAVFDADHDILAVGNGVINLRTGEFSEPDPRYLITKVANVNYDPDATCPEFLKFLRSNLEHEDVHDPDAVIDWLQVALGYTLTGHTDQQIMFILEGPRGSGKSTLLGLIYDILGDYSSTLHIGTLSVKQSRNELEPDLFKARNARFILTSEASDGDRLDASLLKRLTGQDPMSIRTLLGRPIDIVFKGKIWMMTNAIPYLRATETEAWRRIRVIRFPIERVGKDQDSSLKSEVLPAEKSGVLNWLIEGARRYLAGYKLRAEWPADIRRWTEEAQASKDDVWQFLNEYYDLTGNYEDQMPVNEVWDSYKEWAREAELRTWGKRTFSAHIERRGFEKNRGTAGITVFRGIRHKAPAGTPGSDVSPNGHYMGRGR